VFHKLRNRSFHFILVLASRVISHECKEAQNYNSIKINRNKLKRRN
jgi:hypothetical protein